jgi:integrase
MTQPRRAGQIIRKGPGKYIVRVYAGRDATGKRTYVNQTIYGGWKKADAALTKLLDKKSQGRLLVRSHDTVDEFLDSWMETTVRPSVRARTAEDYGRTLRYYVRPYIGRAKLKALTPADVRGLLVKLQGKGLAPRTIRGAHEVLRNALEQAVADRLLPDNPARSRLVAKALPKKEQTEPAVVRADQVAAFIEACAADRLGALFVLQLMSGLRPSEALALRWTDVAGDTIRVTRTLVDVSGAADVYVAAPKSKASRRAVVVPPVVVRTLAEHRKRQAAERLSAGRAWRDHGLVFCDEAGQPLRQYHARRAFKAVCAVAGIEGVRMYGLRHSCATLLLEADTPLKVVSERLGHSTIALTGDVYSHVNRGMQERAADALDRLAR